MKQHKKILSLVGSTVEITGKYEYFGSLVKQDLLTELQFNSIRFRFDASFSDLLKRMRNCPIRVRGTVEKVSATGFGLHDCAVRFGD